MLSIVVFFFMCSSLVSEKKEPVIVSRKNIRLTFYSRIMLRLESSGRISPSRM